MRVTNFSGLSAALLLLVFVHTTLGYVITTPRKWIPGFQAQICFTHDGSTQSAEDELRITVYAMDEKKSENNFGGGGFWPRPLPPGSLNSADTEPPQPAKEVLIPEKVLKPHGDGNMVCDELTIPSTLKRYGQLEIMGSLGGVAINDTKDITFAVGVQKTFIQTDKYLYKAGQKVQFRVLTIQGPFFKVSTEPYAEIYIETPSGSRIFQQLNVANTQGLVHLEMQLIDEPEEGTYSIKVRSPVNSEIETKSFKIEDYVLPRFEVELKPPPYLLADATLLKLEICAMYTFGQPVKGNVTVNLNNNGWRRHKLEMNFNDTLSGCKKLEIPMRTFNVNNPDSFVYSIKAKAVVEEEGTGTTVTKEASISITRTVLTFNKIDTRSYGKPELPAVHSIKAEFPDGKPGFDELLSVCFGAVCTNMTTDAAGVLTIVVPPHLHEEGGKITSLNYPSLKLPNRRHQHYMYSSEIRLHSQNYYSPTNSSLNIMPDSTKLTCVAGEGINLRLPVSYAAVNMTDTVIYIQAISRGQIQFGDTQTEQLTGGDLGIDEALLVEPMRPPFSPSTVRGTFYLTVNLPATVSPKVKIVVWYNRPDGEVVSDAREIEISKCLEHKVNLSWPKDKVEQGTELPLTLTAQPSSLCSLGIVDKSVELLSNKHDSLTLQSIFELAEKANISPYENSQVNDYEYCQKKIAETPVLPQKPFSLTAEQLTPTTISLSWTIRYVPGIDKVEHIVEYKESEGQRWKANGIRMNVLESSTATIRDLKPNTVYKIRVIATSEAGESEPSKILTVNTPTLEIGAVGANPVPLVPSGDLEEMVMNDAPAPPGVPENRKKRSSMPYYHRGHYNADKFDALKMFDESGLYVISDLTLETRPCEQRYPVDYNRTAIGGPITTTFPPRTSVFATATSRRPIVTTTYSAFAFEAPVENKEQKPTAQENPRVYFPETWLWYLSTISDSGSLVQNLTLPDTITEWVAKAVCVHPSTGLGISKPTSITTFTPFFVDLTILPTVKKGEVMPITISVFNYQETSLPVRVILEASPEYEILGETGDEAVADQTQAGASSICLPANDKDTLVVRVRPVKVGDVNVTVSAAVDHSYPEQCGPEVVINKSDRIITPIIVEYEGFPREKTWTKYICTEDLNANEEFAENWRMEAPINIVPQSERGWVTVVGDLLGPTLENLGHLIKMPYGCGEQNMLNFAPNIFVKQYLDASNQSTPAVDAKLKRFMNSGYQRELKYKHRDGSYSAFGESDNSGSTWLTAFVVKSYAQAKPFISIDPAELGMSRDWLIRRQQENGCFESVGKVLHKEMKGGVSGDMSPGVLTAYVMAALLEAGEDPSSEVIANAVYCLEASAKAEGLSKPYESALKTYAYSLAKLPETNQAIESLLQLAVETAEGLYWDVPSSKGGSHFTSDSEVNPVSLEIAGYALMAMMNTSPDGYATTSTRLVKWISQQRNSQGGFISTQDTVVALQSLAVFESFQSEEPLDLMVSVIGDDLSASFKVQESNKLLSQRVDLPAVPMNVMLDLAGTGCALVQGVVRYNVQNAEPSEAFNISVTTSDDYSKNSCKSKKIKTCASYLLNDGASNMAVIEVNLISGFIPEKVDLKRIVGYGTGIIKRYEVDGSKVLFYIDEFTKQDTCVEFGVLQEVAVENPKEGTVKIYDYYEPEFVVTETYTLPRRWDCNRRPIEVMPFLDDIMPIPVEEVPFIEPLVEQQLDLDRLIEALP